MYKKITFSQLFIAIAVIISSQTCRALEPLMPATQRGLVVTLQGHSKAVLDVVFSPDGNKLVSCGGDRTVRLWDVMAGEEIAILYEHSVPETAVYNVAFSPDGNHLASVNGWYYEEPWSPLQFGVSHPTDIPTSIIEETPTPIPTLDPLPNKVILWDLMGAKEQIRWKFDNPMYAVAFSPDGRILAAGGGSPIPIVEGGNAVWLWNTATEELEAILQESAPVWNLTFSPDGKILASGNRNGVTLWDIETHEAKEYLGRISAKAIAFSPDGILLAFGSSLGPISLWDTITHQSQATLEAHDGVVDVVAFSPDGTVLASAGQDGFVRLWDMNTLKTIATIRIPKTRIWSIAFSPDGKLLVSGSSDGMIRVWDMLEVLGQ